MSRKLVLFILILSLVMPTLISQNASFRLSDGSSPSATELELTVYSLWRGTEEQNFLQVIANFTKQTGIPVNHTGFTMFDLQSLVETEFSAQVSSADVIIAPWPVWILDLASQGDLIEVTGLINASKYPANVISLVTNSEGKIYAAPFKLSAKPGFWYKKSFFAKHSLTVSTTFDEFNNTLLPAVQAIPGIEQAIASGNGVGWPLSDTAEAYITGLGGYQLQEDLITGPRVCNWTDQEVVDVFEQLRRQLAAGYFSAPAEWDSQITKFWDEKYGLYFMGSWIIGMPAIGNLSDLDFFGFPGTDGVAGAVDCAFVPAYTGHLHEAKLLFQYLAGVEAQETMVKLGGFLAPNIDVPAGVYSPIDKKILDFIVQPLIHIVPDLDDAIGGTFQPAFWDQLKLLWVNHTIQMMNNVLKTLQEVMLQQQVTGFWTVDDDGPANFHTIQEAVNAASGGDTIYVYNGTYFEHLKVNKSLTLIGESTSGTFVDGGGTEIVLEVLRASNVSLREFTIQNGTIGLVIQEAGYTQMRNISLVGSRYNFKFIEGPLWKHFCQDIDPSNTVDGKPIYFWVNRHEQEIPTDAGFVALINCTGIRMRNLNLSNNWNGILAIEATDLLIKDVTISNTWNTLLARGLSNSTIQNNVIKDSTTGIGILRGGQNNVTDNLVSNNGEGIILEETRNNTIQGNIVFNSSRGIILSTVYDNVVKGNNIAKNNRGIAVYDSYNNSIYHNNMIDNNYQAVISDVHSISINSWDNGVEGNHWSTYAGNDSDNDGIGDTSYIINADNTDNYPLMGMFSSFNASLGEYVNVISNSTIMNFEYFDSNKTINLVVSNSSANQTFGFVRVCILHSLMNETYHVTVNGTEPYYVNYNLADNGTHRWLYFEYEHSTLEVVIIPEFPSLIILPLFIIATLLAIVYREHRPKH